MYEYIRATVQCVFKTDSFLKNPKGKLIISKYGWLFIVIRWLYYSVIFYFRDYHGNWKPFVSPPFGVDLDTYAFLQRSFSLLFGILLMGIISLILSGYLHLIRKKLSLFSILNILGVTFFLPFIIVQPIDVFLRFTIGWVGFILVPIHTLILLWESISATNIISGLCKLNGLEKTITVILIMIIWIVICGILWR